MSEVIILTDFNVLYCSLFQICLKDWSIIWRLLEIWWVKDDAKEILFLLCICIILYFNGAKRGGFKSRIVHTRSSTEGDNEGTTQFWNAWEPTLDCYVFCSVTTCWWLRNILNSSSSSSVEDKSLTDAYCLISTSLVVVCWLIGCKL